MRDAAFDTGVIIVDAVALAELPGGTSREQIRIDWLHKRLAGAPGIRADSIATGARQLRAVLAEVLD